MSSKVGYSAGKSTSKMSISTTAKYSTGKGVPGGKIAPKVGYSAGQNSGTDRDGDPKGAPPNKS